MFMNEMQTKSDEFSKYSVDDFKNYSMQEIKVLHQKVKINFIFNNGELTKIEDGKIIIETK